jgi:hypothetical protein
LQADRIDFSRSSLVEFGNPSLIRALESSINAAFASYRRPASEPLSSGSTETCDESIQPGVLQLIDAFRRTGPGSMAGSREKQPSCPVKFK